MISEKIMSNKTLVEQCYSVSIQQLILGGINTDCIEIDGQMVQLDRTKCHYGGYRVWFLCPACHRRIGNLYRKPLSNQFFCRHCNNLTYQLMTFHRSRYESFIKAVKGGINE